MEVNESTEIRKYCNFFDSKGRKRRERIKKRERMGATKDMDGTKTKRATGVTENSENRKKHTKHQRNSIK